MKKRIIAILTSVLLLAGLVTGCQGKQESSMEVSSLGEQTEKPEGEKPDFVIYRPPRTNEFEYLMLAIAQFNNAYRKELNIIFEDFNSDMESFQTRTAAELMAGNGPDILFLQYMSMNPNKAMQNNVFLDLNPYLEQDKNFGKDDYLPHVFEAGRRDGKQYIVPVIVDIPIMFSNTEKLAEIGITEVAQESTAAFMRQIAEAAEIARQKPGFLQMMPYRYYFYTFCLWSDPPLIDYEQKKVCSNEKALRDFFESYKLYYPYDQVINENYDICPSFIEEPVTDSHFFDEAIKINTALSTASYLKGSGSHFTLSSLRDENGKLQVSYRMSVGVRANCQSPDYAYQFIRILLSQQIQEEIGSYKNMERGYPVNKTALYKIANDRRDRFTTEKMVQGGFAFEQISKSELQEFLDLICSVEGSSISGFNDAVIKMAWEAMEPYFRDERSYESCFEELKGKLMIYLDE